MWFQVKILPINPCITPTWQKPPKKWWKQITKISQRLKVNQKNYENGFSDVGDGLHGAMRNPRVEIVRYFIYNQLRYPALPRLICNLLNIFCFSNSFQKCVLQLLGLQAPQAQMGRWWWVKPAPKPCLDSWDVCAKFHWDLCRGLDFH